MYLPFSFAHWMNILLLHMAGVLLDFFALNFPGQNYAKLEFALFRLCQGRTYNLIFQNGRPSIPAVSEKQGLTDRFHIACSPPVWSSCADRPVRVRSPQPSAESGEVPPAGHLGPGGLRPRPRGRRRPRPTPRRCPLVENLVGEILRYKVE